MSFDPKHSRVESDDRSSPIPDARPKTFLGEHGEALLFLLGVVVVVGLGIAVWVMMRNPRI